MKDIPIQATEEAIKLMKDKNQKQTSSPNIHIEPSESPKFTVWMNCADYVMRDYLWMAMKTFCLLLSDRFGKSSILFWPVHPLYKAVIAASRY